MAIIDYTSTTRPVVPVGPVGPVEPVDPTHCPTCLSGTPPRDPWYEEAIEDDRASYRS
jgi:hypothetical protein